jgi:hypothetical protein
LCSVVVGSPFLACSRACPFSSYCCSCCCSCCWLGLGSLGLGLGWLVAWRVPVISTPTIHHPEPHGAVVAHVRVIRSGAIVESRYVTPTKSMDALGEEVYGNDQHPRLRLFSLQGVQVSRDAVRNGDELYMCSGDEKLPGALPVLFSFLVFVECC